MLIIAPIRVKKKIKIKDGKLQLETVEEEQPTEPQEEQSAKQEETKPTELQEGPVVEIQEEQPIEAQEEQPETTDTAEEPPTVEQN